MVRQHRLVRGLLVAVCVAVVALCLFVAVLVVEYLQTCNEASCGFTDFAVLLLIVALTLAMAATMIGYSIFTWRTIARHDRARELAARNGVPAISLEGELRTASTAAIALPATMRIRLAWRTKQMGIIFGSVFVFIEVIYGCTFLSMRSNPTITARDDIVVQGFMVGTLVLTFCLLWFAARERVVATDDRMSVRRFGMTRRIRWSEARLFAKVKPAEYELSGPRAIVRWTRPVDGSSCDTVIPFEQYQRQMDGLLLLIANRTGLPLADLREPTR
jgi:hypothetical protein